jgi:hypothetical protein
MDEFELSDDDFAALTEPPRTDTWLASFDAGLRRAGVPDHLVQLRHTIDRAVLADPRVSEELRDRACLELYDDATLERLTHAPGGPKELTLAWLATLVKWSAQYEVLAVVGRLDQDVFFKAARYVMEAGGFMSASDSTKPTDVT